MSFCYFQKSLYVYCSKYLSSVMIKYFVMRNLRGTCLSVEMLKGYIVRERSGTPELEGVF